MYREAILEKRRRQILEHADRARAAEVFVDVGRGLDLVCNLDFPEASERSQAMYATGAVLGAKLKVARVAVMMEAWMSLGKAGSPRRGSPSQDPQRQDIVMYVESTGPGKLESTIYLVETSPDGPVLSVIDPIKEGTSRSFLIEAFWDGYTDAVETKVAHPIS